MAEELAKVEVMDGWAKVYLGEKRIFDSVAITASDLVEGWGGHEASLP
jgi:hypothetical protein